MLYSHCIEENIRHNECDAAGKLKLHSLFDRLQNAAAEHAAVLNVGMEELAEKELIWVLSRLKISLIRPPLLGEKLAVTTYPTGVQRIFAHRCYDLRIGGERIGCAGSFWLPVNAAAGKPVNARKVLPPEIIDLPDVEKFFPDMDKLADAAAENSAEYSVGAGDIDLNCHLNNAVYARWISDMLGIGLGKYDFAVREMQINFLSSGQFGEKITLNCEVQQNGFFTVSGKKADESSVFQSAGVLF